MTFKYNENKNQTSRVGGNLLNNKVLLCVMDTSTGNPYVGAENFPPITRAKWSPGFVIKTYVTYVFNIFSACQMRNILKRFLI